MKKLFNNFWRNEKGATVIEYVVVASIVMIFAIGSIKLFATGQSGSFSNTMSTVNSGLR